MESFNEKKGFGREKRRIGNQIYTTNRLDVNKIHPGYLVWDKTANLNVGAWFYKDEKNAVIELTTGKLGDLSNVVITAPSLGNPLNGQVLTWDRSILAWTNKPIPQQIPPAPLATITNPTTDQPQKLIQNVGDYYIAGVAGNYKNFTSPLNPTGVTAAKGDSIYWDGNNYILRVAPQSGASTLTDLTDTTITNPVKEDALVWDGTAWINKPATVIPKDPLATLLIPATDNPSGTQKPGDYYIAGVDGTYTNFGGVTATQGQRIYWDGTNYIVKDSYEVYLGNPTKDGQILSSTIAGVRSWIDGTKPPAAGIPDLAALTLTPTKGEFDAMTAKINTILATLRTANIIALPSIPDLAPLTATPAKSELDAMTTKINEIITALEAANIITTI